MSTQFNPYAAAQNPYGPPQQSGFPPQPSPYGGGFPPQMPPDAFGPGMGAPVGPGGGLRPYEAGGIADDSNGDLSVGSEGGLLSKIFSLKGLLTIGGIGALAYAAKRYFSSDDAGATDETGKPSAPAKSPALKASKALSATFQTLRDASSKSTVYTQIEADLKKLNAASKKPVDGDDPLSSAQRDALNDLNTAYGFDPEDADSYDASAELADLDFDADENEYVADITAAHTTFEKAFAPKPSSADDTHTHD